MAAIVATSDSSGNVTSATQYVYNSFGEPTNWSGSRFRYTGQIALNDAASAKLFHHKARVFDPGIGRFLQTDPIGYRDDINLYAYGRNDPMNKTDPTGTHILLDGERTATRAFIRQASAATGMRLKLKRGKLVEVGKPDPSKGNQVAAGILRNAINAKETIRVQAVENDPLTAGDSYATNKYDVTDMATIATKGPEMGAAVLTHVISERMFNAQNGGDVELSLAHEFAKVDEARAFGQGAFTRMEKSDGGPLTGPMEGSWTYVDMFMQAVAPPIPFSIDASGVFH